MGSKTIKRRAGRKRSPRGTAAAKLNLTAGQKAERADELAIEQRMRRHGCDRRTAKREDFSSVAGQLYQRGKITERHYKAACAFSSLSLEHYHNKGIAFPTPRAIEPGRTRGRGKDIDPVKAKRTTARYLAAIRAFEAIGGHWRPLLERACDICHFERLEALDWPQNKLLIARAGLDILADHFRIPK